MLQNVYCYKIYISLLIIIIIFNLYTFELSIHRILKKKDATFSRLIINVSWAPNHISEGSYDDTED